MDIRTLTYFIEIAREQNISKAAEKLHMSQPPLSRQMQLLEEELGVTLMVRGKRRITLTQEGEFLLERAQKIVDLTDRTTEEISSISNRVAGKLYIGSIESISVGIMPKWIVQFGQKYPEVSFNWWSGNSNDVLQRLEHGVIDLAIVRTPCDNEKFQSIPLYREPWAIYLQEDFAEGLVRLKDSGFTREDLKKDELPLDRLAGVPLIIPSIRTREQEITQWFQSRQMEPQIICEISPAMNAISLVEEQMGAAILPQSANHAAQGKRILVKKLVNPPLESEVIIAYNRGIHLSHAAEQFIDFVCKCVRFDSSQTI